MDASGVTRLSVPAGLQPVSAVISQRVSDVLRTREIAFQDFYLNEYDHRPYLTLLVPILDTNSDKRPIGVVTLRINPETYLYPFISLWPSPSRTAETLIIRREGRDILFLNELRFRKNTALKLRIPLERKEVVSVQAALGRNGIVEGLDYAGVTVVAYVRAVPDSPWVIIARMNADEIYAPLRKQLWTIIALIAALLIGTGSGVALLWRQQHVRFYQERYAAAEELRKSEERYRVLFNAMDEGFCIVEMLFDPDGKAVDYRFVETNPAFEKQTGLQQALGKTIRQMVPEHEAHWFEIYGKVARTGEAIRFENPAHGLQRYYDVFAFRLGGDESRRVAILFNDITGHKRAEETIKKNLQIQNILNSLLKVSLEGIPLKDLLEKSLDIVLSVPFLPLMPKGGIFIVEDEPATLVLTANRGFSLPIQEICARVPFGKCLCGRAAASRQIQFADCMDERHENSYDGIIPHGHYNVPILSMGKVLGVLVLYLQEGHQQEESELEFLQAVANAIAGIIERKQLENALRKFNEELTEKVTERTADLEKANTELKKLFNAIEQTEELIVITDANGAIEYVNPAFTRKTGYSREEAIGKNPRILQSGLTTIELYNELWKTILSGNPWKGTFINRKKSGEFYYEDATIAPVFDENGKITHFVAAKTDVTDRITAEEELKRNNTELELAKETAESANRAKSEFLANMSHELRTPLNSIIGFSEILKDGMAGPMPDKQKELLNDISTSGRQLLFLINDILDLSKAKAGQMELELSEFNLEELINGSLVMFKETAIKHNIKIVAEVEVVIGNIIADERKIKQVLFNLLSNAVKFTPEGGSVRVQARRVHSSQFTVHGEENTVNQYCEPSTVDREPSDFIEVSVTDTGIGIAPEDREKLFQPFQQMDSTLSRKYSGTGLGLNLCKQFIELHGGRIWIENEVERGSRFVFVIPARK
jgi:PAS domain S-box-containing protein